MIATIIISVLLIAVVALIIAKLIKDKKAGKGGCGCGCENCAMSKTCQRRD